MHIRSTATAFLLLALAACDATTAPEPTLTMQLTATATSQLQRDAAGSALISCDIGLRATAIGDEGTDATWEGGVVRYFIAADTVAVDSQALNALDLGQAFGGTRIVPGFDESTTLRVVASVPFSVHVSLAYQVTGREQEDRLSASAVCGPRPGDGPPPVLSNVSVQPSAAELQPGDTLTLTWTAQSPLGLWEVGYMVNGAFEASGRIAQFATKDPVTTTVHVVVPPEALLGGRVQIRPIAIDAALQTAGGPVYTSTPVVDNQSPELQSVYVNPNRPGTSPDGQFAAGDTLTVYPVAFDNHTVSYVVFEAGPGWMLRDSVRFPVPWSGGAKLSVPTTWAGQQGLRVQVRDLAGNASRWITSQTASFYPLSTVPVHRVNMPDRVRGVAIDASRRKLYAAVGNEGRLRVFSLPGLVEEAPIPLPGNAFFLDLTPTGDTVVSISGNTMIVADVVRGGTPRVHQFANVQELFGVRVGPGGRAVTMAFLDGGGRALLDVDPATGSYRTVPGSHVVPGLEQGVARSLDRRRMIVGGGCLYDAVAGTLGSCRTMEGDLPLAGDATGDRWTRQGMVFGADLSLALRLSDGTSHVGFATALRGDGIYASGVGRLIRARVTDGRYEVGFPVPGIGNDLRFSDDGALLVGWTDIMPGGRYGIIVMDMR